jgi:hypothetical protein
MDGHTSARERNGNDGSYEDIDDDYYDGYYGWKGAKRAAVFREKAERTRRACAKAEDHGQAGAARQHAGHTTQEDVRQPTRVHVAGGVPVTSGGRRARLADVAHRSWATEW